MTNQRGLTHIWVADLIVRSAYQMGKAPLLPIFAVSLGASETYLGFIVSVSTLTGMLLKPAVGILSDRWGRRGWLILGTAIFSGVPFLYQFITTPQQLLILRLFHGCATAIYGPVTLAYVSDQSREHVAERIGWFSLARSGGYILGPALAGLLLLFWDPIIVFTLIGVISMLAFIPVLLVTDSVPRSRGKQDSLGTQLFKTLRTEAKSSILWLAGSLEATGYLLLYAIKTFLPIYALTSGISPGVVGSLFAAQETVTIFLKPAGGRLGDRIGYLPAICIGMLLLGSGAIILALAKGNIVLGLVAILLGSSQALIFPATVAWLATDANTPSTGGALGVLGALRNGGKITGPVLAGFLISHLSYAPTFLLLGDCLLTGGLILLLHVSLLQPKRERANQNKLEKMEVCHGNKT